MQLAGRHTDVIRAFQAMTSRQAIGIFEEASDRPQTSARLFCGWFVQAGSPQGIHFCDLLAQQPEFI